MEIDLNWVAVLAGMAIAMVLGMVWYSPGVFGKRWMNAVGLTEKQMKNDQSKGMLWAIIRSFVLSFALYHIIYVTAAFYTDDSFLKNAVGTGVWVGVAIVGLTILMHDAFESRPKIVTKVNVGFEVLTVIAVATAIGLVGL